MDLSQAIPLVLDSLRRQGKATNSQILAIVGGDETLFREVCESLILDDLAEDKNGVGLVYIGPPVPTSNVKEQIKLFLSYGRRDAKDLAERLVVDLRKRGFDVWLDTREIASGTSWQHEIADGLRSAQVVIALLSPHSVRTSTAPDSPDGVDSICLGEIAYALFQPPSKPIVPVMASHCEPPLAIFHLDYVDLTRWRDAEDQYRAGLDRLLDGIDAVLRGEKRYRSWHHQLEPWDFAAFLHDKRRDFTGRQWLFEELDIWRTSTRHERALLITGDPGTGKSAIVAELVHRNPSGQVIAYHCCQSDTPATLEPWRFVRSIAAMIASRLPDYAAQLEAPSIREILSEESCRDDPAGALERAVLAPLESLAAPNEGVRYLLIDALDESLTLKAGLTIVQLLASRLNRLPGWLRVVATTRKEPEVLNRLRGLRAQELNAQETRNREDVAAYLNHRLDSPNLSERMVQAGYSRSAVFDALIQKCEGNFLYARQALDGLEGGLYSLDDLDSLPSGLYDLYDAFFRRQFGEQGESFAEPKRILEVLVAAREPLTAEELAAATGLHPRRELPVVLNRLAAFVSGRSDGGGTVTYATFHKSLADWLTAVDLLGTTFSVLPEEGHRKLADWGIREYAAGVPTMSPYTLRQTATHLINAESWDDLESLFLDLCYLERRNESGQMFDLVRDFGNAMLALPVTRPMRRILKLLNEALRRDLHFIARHAQDYPQALFQCLWNSAWWYDCPAAAEFYRDSLPHDRVPEETRTAKNSLSSLLEQWRNEKWSENESHFWVESLRPPLVHLGTALVGMLEGHENAVISICFSPDGSQIITGSWDGTIRIWDAVTGQELQILASDEKTLTCVQISRDGTTIASSLKDGSIRIRDRATGELLRTIRVPEKPEETAENARWSAIALQRAKLAHEAIITSVCFSPDGRHLAATSNDKKIRIWDVSTGAHFATLFDHRAEVVAVCYSPDGRHLASASHDRSIRIWNTESCELEKTMHGHLHAITSISFDPTGTMLVSGGRDETVRVWDLEKGENTAIFNGHSGAVMSVQFVGHDRVVSSSMDGTLRLWDLATGKQVQVFLGHQNTVQCVAVSPNGGQIVSGSFDRSARIWDSSWGEPLCEIDGHSEWVSSVSMSPDGTRFATASRDNTVRVWDTRSGQSLLQLKGHNNTVYHVAFSADGCRIATGSWDRTVRIWDAVTGKSLARIDGNSFPPEFQHPRPDSDITADSGPFETRFLGPSGELLGIYPAALTGIVLATDQIFAGFSRRQVQLLRIH